MKRHFTNAGYGVLDYLSYPIGMLLVAPIVLHKLGAAEYGLWMIATAVISAGGMIASGFCDACIQRVAHLRGTGEFTRMPYAVQSMLAINLALGVLLTLGAWIAAPYAAVHVAVSQQTPIAECLIALRIGTLCILLRSMEGVAVGVQRAFEQYRGTVQISTAMRLLTLVSAAALAGLGFRTPSILVATAIFLALGTVAQVYQARRLLQGASFWPVFHAAEGRALFGNGLFIWFQTLGSVIFAQLDRILLGISLGALVVAPYSLCVQFAHPIYGLSASGLNFLFPYLSSRASSISNTRLRQTALKAFACNLILVAGMAGLLLLIGDRLIRIWAGAAVAESAAKILPPIVIGSALMGLSVTGTYAMQALGQFRTVAIISLAGRAAMLLMMIEMLRYQGLQGLALSRLCCGFVALLVYVPLLKRLGIAKSSREAMLPLSIAIEAREGSKP